MRAGPSMAIGLLLVASGCKREDGLIRTSVEAIATTTGDFDDVAAPLDRAIVDHTEYEGLISTATWDEDYDPAANALKVEELLTSSLTMLEYDLIIVASGTRGLGLREYNGLDADDALVADETVRDNVRLFVERGGTLVVTDWAYDLVEATWPDLVDFVGDDGVYDDAQRGEIGTITARVVDDTLEADLGMAEVAVGFNFSNWAVIEDVSSDATVWLRGDVEYRKSDEEGLQPLPDVPVLVSGQPEGENGGRVVVASFHLDAQTAEVIDQMLLSIVGEFKSGQQDPSSQQIEE